MFGRKLTLAPCIVILAGLTSLDQATAKTITNQQQSITLAQTSQRQRDGWDDSYVSEQLIDKDNEQAKEREKREESNENSAENIEKSFAQTVLKQKIEQIKDEALMFSKTLDKSHLQNAVEMRNALID